MLSFALLHKSFKLKYWLLQFPSSGGIAPIHFPCLCLLCVSAFCHLFILLLGMQSLVSEPCQLSTRHIHSGYVCVLIIMLHLTEAIIFSNEDLIWSAIHSELGNCVILASKTLSSSSINLVIFVSFENPQEKVWWWTQRFGHAVVPIDNDDGDRGRYFKKSPERTLHASTSMYCQSS
jgi:hypothetical protein